MIGEYNLRTSFKQKLAGFSAALLLLSSGIGLLNPVFAHAATALTITPQISFTFDDGLLSTYTNAAPTLQKYGLVGTDYVISGCVGMTTAPNTCAADNNGIYMTYAQIQALQNTYGWEIGGHTADHGCMASDAILSPDDCTNAAPLTFAQLETELNGSKQTLQTNGLNITDMAWPYGDYGNASLSVAAKYFATTRGFADNDANNVFPFNDLVLHDQQFQAGAPTTAWAICPDMSVAGAESCIDNAITNKQWVVLVFHNITATPNTTTSSYDEATANLDAIAAYAAAKQTAGLVKVVTPSKGIVTGTNLLPNGDFVSGITGGWTTDSASITADANNNGRYPEPTHSVLLKGGATDTHLYSPKVAVTSGQTYVLKNYVNILSGTSVNFYINEYDASGNALPGVDPKAGIAYIDCAVTTKCIDVADVNFTYTPSSASVASASLQVIVKGAATQAYYDGAQWFIPGSTLKAGDVNGDGAINLTDLSLLSSHWNTASGATRAQGDLNGDGAVNLTDLSILSSNWGK